MFADLDRLDANAWAARLAPDAVLRVGNGDPVHGRERCRDALASFCSRLDGLRHEVLEQWEHGAATIVEASVTCSRAGADAVTLPMVTIYRTDDRDLICDYRVYVDPAPMLGVG